MKTFVVFSGIVGLFFLSDFALSKPSTQVSCYFSYVEKSGEKNPSPKTDFVLPKSNAFEFSLTDGEPGYQVNFEFPNSTNKINLQIAKVFNSSNFSTPPIGLSLLFQTVEEKRLLEATNTFNGRPDDFQYIVSLNDESPINLLIVECSQ